MSYSTHSVPDAIDIERGVDHQRIIVNVGPDIAALGKLDRVSRQGKKSFRRVCDILIHIARVIARRSHVVEVAHVRLTRYQSISD
jgi:hypothetical protein